MFPNISPSKFPSPAPSKEWRSGTAGTHDPGEHHGTDGLALSELEASEGFADDHVSLKSQNSKGPSRHKTCENKTRISTPI